MAGPIVTAMGASWFTAASMDNMMHAFDAENGKEIPVVWKLPAGEQAARVTYVVGGKQYVV